MQSMTHETTIKNINYQITFNFNIGYAKTAELIIKSKGELIHCGIDLESLDEANQQYRTWIQLMNAERLNGLTMTGDF